MLPDRSRTIETLVWPVDRLNWTRWNGGAASTGNPCGIVAGYLDAAIVSQSDWKWIYDCQVIPCLSWLEGTLNSFRVYCRSASGMPGCRPPRTQ